MPFVPPSIPGTGGGGGSISQVADSLLTVDTATFDFAGIAATFLHLRLIINARMTGAVTVGTINLTLNNDSGANYDWEVVFGSAATATATGAAAAAFIVVGDTTGASGAASRAGAQDVMIPNYAQTTFMKHVVSDSHVVRGTATTDFFGEQYGGLWRNTAAVNRITLTPSSGNWLAGSRATLYGYA